MATIEDPRLVALVEGVSGAPRRDAHEWTAQSLRRALALGIFGGRFPAERQLADMLGVSRITVRIALQTLREAGEVRSFPGRGGGTFPVNPPPTSSEQGVVAAARADIWDILAFRAAIEPAAAESAARKREPEILDRLDRSLSIMEGGASQEAFAEGDSEFHLAIAQATHSARLLHALLVTRADLLLWRRQLPQLNYDPSFAQANWEEHLVVVKAIRAGNGRAAHDAMARHLDSAQTAFRQVLDASLSTA